MREEQMKRKGLSVNERKEITRQEERKEKSNIMT